MTEAERDLHDKLAELAARVIAAKSDPSLNALSDEFMLFAVEHCKPDYNAPAMDVEEMFNQAVAVFNGPYEVRDLLLPVAVMAYVKEFISKYKLPVNTDRPESAWPLFGRYFEPLVFAPVTRGNIAAAVRNAEEKYQAAIAQRNNAAHA